MVEEGDENTENELELGEDTEEATELPSGFNVIAPDGTHLGNYPTEADAQAFIDGHAPDAEYVRTE